MTNSEHDPKIQEHADTLRMYQQNHMQVMITLETDEEIQATMHYWGRVKSIISEIPDPYVDITAEKLAIEYITQKHHDRNSLFDLLSSYRETVSPSNNAAEALLNDIKLMGTVESEVGIIHQDQTIEFGDGVVQRIALSGISMIFGISTNT